VLFTQMGPIDVSADAEGYGTLRIQTGIGRGSVAERSEVAGVPGAARAERLQLEQQGEAC